MIANIQSCTNCVFSSHIHTYIRKLIDPSSTGGVTAEQFAVWKDLLFFNRKPFNDTCKPVSQIWLTKSLQFSNNWLQTF